MLFNLNFIPKFLCNLIKTNIMFIKFSPLPPEKVLSMCLLIVVRRRSLMVVTLMYVREAGHSFKFTHFYACCLYKFMKHGEK